MSSRQLLIAAIATAMGLAACAQDTDSLTDGTGRDMGQRAQGGAASSTTGASSFNPDTFTGPLTTNSPEGLAFYTANVHPFLAAQCGSCHGAPGPGPYWLTSSEAHRSYAQLFGQGYVIPQSRIIMKGPHNGVTTNVLTADQSATYEQWVAMELKDGGGKAPPNILEKLGACFDRAKFDDMALGQWRTTRRQTENNLNAVNPWNENANQCTGCNNAPCTTCHSADPATNYNNAVGNNLLPADTTFENTKLTMPAYITKYFGVSPDGKPIPSNGIQKKSDATKKDKAYTHPMFQLTAAQQTALDAFVTDVITKFNAGTCGQ